MDNLPRRVDLTHCLTNGCKNELDTGAKFCAECRSAYGKRAAESNAVERTYHSKGGRNRSSRLSEKLRDGFRFMEGE